MYVTMTFTVAVIPFVTIFSILNLKTTGLLKVPGFFTHTDTVPELYWGSPLMGTEVMGCLTDVKLAKFMPIAVVLTMYSINDRAASSDGFHDTCKSCAGKTRTLNDPMQWSEDEGTQLIYTK